MPDVRMVARLLDDDWLFAARFAVGKPGRTNLQSLFSEFERPGRAFPPCADCTLSASITYMERTH